MWAFVTSFCTIRYFNLSGINDLSQGMADAHTSETQMYQLVSSFLQNSIKKKGLMVTPQGLAMVLEEITTLRKSSNPGQDIISVSFRIIKQCFLKYETCTPW